MRRFKVLNIATASAAALLIAIGFYFLARTGLPSADVVAATQEAYPIINVSDYEPGDVEVLVLNNIPIFVWRRNEADRLLATKQNDPSEWNHQYSTIYGQPNPVFADDANLTLNGEWFFALARPKIANSFGTILMSRTGDFDGFFDSHRGGHFDVSGRFQKGYRYSNMIVVRGEMTIDQIGIRLDLSGVPKLPLSLDK